MHLQQSRNLKRVGWLHSCDERRYRYGHATNHTVTGGFIGTTGRLVKDCSQGTLLSKQDDTVKRWTENANQEQDQQFYSAWSYRDEVCGG